MLYFLGSGRLASQVSPPAAPGVWDTAGEIRLRGSGRRSGQRRKQRCWCSAARVAAGDGAAASGAARSEPAPLRGAEAGTAPGEHAGCQRQAPGPTLSRARIPALKQI